MATVAYVPDQPPPPIDAKLQEIAQQAALADRPIRIRIQPDLYSIDVKGYQSWLGLIWAVDVDDFAEGQRLREGLTKFFQAFGDGAKQAQLLKVLEGL